MSDVRKLACTPIPCCCVGCISGTIHQKVLDTYKCEELAPGAVLVLQQVGNSWSIKRNFALSDINRCPRSPLLTQRSTTWSSPQVMYGKCFLWRRWAALLHGRLEATLLITWIPLRKNRAWYCVARCRQHQVGNLKSQSLIELTCTVFRWRRSRRGRRRSKHPGTVSPSSGNWRPQGGHSCFAVSVYFTKSWFITRFDMVFKSFCGIKVY
jgi:hypothetical protein